MIPDNRGRDALLRVLSLLLIAQRNGSLIGFSGARTRGSASLPSGGKTGPLSRNENYPEIRIAPTVGRDRVTSYAAGHT
jgi:hypothetical protein